jgi:ABC-type multidrug transport system fused ATPase/permease subunit
MNILKTIYSLLNHKQKIQSFYQLIIIIISMFFEILSLGMLIPIITLISTNDISKKYPYLKSILEKIGNPSQHLLLQYVLILFVSIYVIKTLFMVFATWYNYKFVFNLQMFFSEKIFRGYLYQPSLFHSLNNTSVLIQNSTLLIATLSHVLINILIICSEIISALAILILLFKIQPLSILIILITFSPFIYLFNFFTKKLLLNIGKSYQDFEGKRIKLLQEGLGASKEIKLMGKEEFFISQYDKNNITSLNLFQKQQTLQAVPKFLMEFLAAISICLLVFILGNKKSDLSEIVTTLALLAGAAFRLIPSINRIIASSQTIRFNTSAINTLKNVFESIDKTFNEAESIQLEIVNIISLENIYFKFPNSEKYTIENLSLKIPIGNTVGIIGSTGAGKSTLIDIILGLLNPNQGIVKVNQVPISNATKSWQRNIGYVPQSIYLIDDTLRKNIAFGLSEDDIDDDLVNEAIRSAQLENLVLQLSNGIDTEIGERGVRLSGGERQRIGIARALYNSPKILVLDEATSSLDVNTERDVMKSVLLLKNKITIIIVAHRLTTVENCDYIYKINNGKIEEEGIPKNVLNN